MAKVQSETQAPAHTPDAEHDLTRDEIYEILSNRRRRYALHYLRQRGSECVALSALAAQIAAWEHDDVLGETETTPTERKHVYTALQQFHLPKMVEMGIVAYDHPEGTVTLTAAGSGLDVYLDVVRGSDVPWSLYYVGFSTVSVALVAGVATALYPIRLLPDLAWLVFLVAVLCISSLAHRYDTRAKRFGAEGPPPGVERR